MFFLFEKRAKQAKDFGGLRMLLFHIFFEAR